MSDSVDLVRTSGPSLLISLKDSAGNVLATIELTPAETNNAIEEYALSNSVTLFAGETYTMHAGFAGVETNANYYKFAQLVTDWKPYGSLSSMEGPATYGGTAWYTYKKTKAGVVTKFTDKDGYASFSGKVVPEPMTLALMAFGGLAVLRRRRR